MWEEEGEEGVTSVTMGGTKRGQRIVSNIEQAVDRAR